MWGVEPEELRLVSTAAGIGFGRWEFEDDGEIGDGGVGVGEL